MVIMYVCAILLSIESCQLSWPKMLCSFRVAISDQTVSNEQNPASSLLTNKACNASYTRTENTDLLEGCGVHSRGDGSCAVSNGVIGSI
jgi:hypothetical protein